MEKISFVVNLCPFDHRLYMEMLTHQYNVFGEQSDEFLIIYDSNPGKIRGKWIEIDKQVLEGVSLFAKVRPNVRILHVPYQKEAQAEIASYFMNKNAMPTYDFRGYPIIAFYYSLFAPRNDLIMHIDSDMFFGGGSGSWMAEAAEMLNQDPSILTVSPLPGPPRVDGRLKNKNYRPLGTKDQTFIFRHFSTRVFMLNRVNLKGRLWIKKPGIKRIVYALLNGFPLCDTAEEVITKMMQRKKLKRIDFLGTGPGLWSLHPQRRSDKFFETLPTIISRVVNENVPDEQRGYYDFADEFFDWEGVYKPAKK